MQKAVVTHGVLWVDGRLVLRRFANQPLSISSESNDRRSGSASLVIRDDLYERTSLLVFNEDANVFFFLYSSFEQVSNRV
jgi:hypothetical protein